MNRYLVSIAIALVIAIAIPIAIAESSKVIEAPAPPPKLPVLRVVTSESDWQKIVVNTTGSISVNFTKEFIELNGTGRVVLSDWYSYEIDVVNGSVAVGYLENSSAIMNFTIDKGSSVILHTGTVYYNNMKYIPNTSSIDLQPFIEINGSATIRLIVLYHEVKLSNPVPPFQGETYNGQCDPSRPTGIDAWIWSRLWNRPGRYKIAFWEKHERSDIDAIIVDTDNENEPHVFLHKKAELYSDNGEWEIRVVAVSKGLLIKVRQYRCPTPEPWLLVVKNLDASDSNNSSSSSSGSSTAAIRATTTMNAASSGNSKAIWIAAGIGILILIIVAVAIAGRRR